MAIINPPQDRIPKLPKGYFFRVTTSSSTHWRYEVQLRKKWLIGSLKKKCGHFDYLEENRILDEMTGLKNWAESLEKQNADKQRFLGDYPPKKIIR